MSERPLTMTAERLAHYRGMAKADEWTDQYLHVRELLAELDALRVAHDSSAERMWDENSIQCDNCSAQIMARGGSLKSNGLSQSDGEDEMLCGHCAGLELDSSEQTIREQCAKIAESYYDPKESNDFILARIEIAAAIRGGK